MKITALVFAYNQENYIEEALNSVLNQAIASSQYEIVVSDDCSTDRTFEIIQKIVNEYNGPFQIKINQNTTNLGLIGHLNYIFNNFIKTSHVIIQAGDDVSLFNRASSIENYFHEYPNVSLLVSDAFRINSSGEILGRYIHPKNYSKYYWNTFDLISKGNMHYGAGIGMNSKVFTDFGDLDSSLRIEDDAFALRASLLGDLGLIKEPLLKYRFHDKNLTERINRADSIQQKKTTYMSRLNERIVQLKHLKSFIKDNKKLTFHLEKEINRSSIKVQLCNEKLILKRLFIYLKNCRILKLKILLLVVSREVFFKII